MGEVLGTASNCWDFWELGWSHGGVLHGLCFECRSLRASRDGGSEGQTQQASGNEDLTESILHSLNMTADEDEAGMGLTDDMDQATVGKVLAESVMKQLLAKSILYDPMKDLSEKYAEWLESDVIEDFTAEELERHRQLHGSIKELIHVYETDPENMPKLMELFEKSQSFGSPPEAVYESLVENTESVSDDDFPGLPKCFQQ